MSENTNKQEVVWADGTWIRSKVFDDGGEILKLSIAVDKFTQFLTKYKKQDGFVNLIISKKREPDEKSSHTVKLDTWVPKIQTVQASKPVAVKQPVKAKAPVEDDYQAMF